MEKKKLVDVFSGRCFQIPDYQRGYAWGKKQVEELIGDISSLVEDDTVFSHYTGTIVTFWNKGKFQKYGVEEHELHDIVDGQQRLTTILLFLGVIINQLIDEGKEEYRDAQKLYLFSGETLRLKLNNSTSDAFLQLLKNGELSSESFNQQSNLNNSYKILNGFVQHKKKEEGLGYLENLYKVITLKLIFTSYTIEEECEIGMTFELMNSRGKPLTVLELLKNYLMYWVSRNSAEDERVDLTLKINNAWRDVFVNLDKANGTGEQCLRVAWIFYCDHTPKQWQGYDGFKQTQYVPLRDFSKKSKKNVEEFIKTFVEGLTQVSKHYASVTCPVPDQNRGEYNRLTNILRTGNIANFLPLIIASRIQWKDGTIQEKDYFQILQEIEKYAFRVFLFEGKRSNSGLNTFYKLGSDVFSKKIKLLEATEEIHKLIHHFSSAASFEDALKKPSNWYARRNLIKYVLYDYELHLLTTEGKGAEPLLAWEKLNDSTLEHILPQEPNNPSQWIKDWSEEQRAIYTHDLGNMVLTSNNSNYRNFEFSRKKGSPGVSPSYTDSDIRQERRISRFDSWTINSLKERREELVSWILNRWKVEPPSSQSDINEADDEE